MRRAHTYNVRFSPVEWDRFEAICAYHGLSGASLLRSLLMKEERSITSTPAGMQRFAATLSPPTGTRKPRKGKR